MQIKEKEVDLESGLDPRTEGHLEMQFYFIFFFI